MTLAHPYEALLPDTVIDAIESLGLLSDGRILPLNSYENRVYRIGMEDQAPCIAKFYRPERWSKDAILEEHAFMFELQSQDICVVPPMQISDASLHQFAGFHFALFPMQGGYAPELDCPDTLYRIGSNIGRIHQVGRSSKFQHRRSLEIQSFGQDSRDFLLNESFIPDSLIQAYDSLTNDLLKRINETMSIVDTATFRIHGDCHIGNILWRDDLAYFVDFDDCMNGPAIQDIWLMLSGDRPNRIAQLSEFLEGYEEFCDFNPRELHLIESLRTLRMMNYAAWLARRWTDPAFKMHFSWFGTERYWSEHILELREQLAALDEPPLQLMP